MASAQPTQPKKPVGGGFGRFLAEKRAELLMSKELEGKPIAALAKLASERYKQLSEEERTQWCKKFEEAKEQYSKDMEAFEAAGGQKSSPKSKRKKDKKMVKKDPAAPKKPAGGAYGRYMAKHREELMKECEGKPITEITKLGGQRWKALSEEAKQPYEDEYKKAMDEYREAMKSYVPPAAEEPAAENPAAAKAKGSQRKAGKRVNKSANKASNLESTPPAKKARSAVASAKKAAGAVAKKVLLDEDVADRAEKAGMSANLLKLAALEDVVARGKGHAEMLKALEESNGLFHPARRALLGA